MAGTIAIHASRIGRTEIAASASLRYARDFAIRVHGDQMYGTRPYVTHLDDVAEIVAPYGAFATMVAFLHDVVEDTSATIDDIAYAFGELAARSVLLLSDPSLPNRRLRKIAMADRFRGADDGLTATTARIVKAADRLANMRRCIQDRDMKRLRMYADESALFVAAVYAPGVCEPIWTALEQAYAQALEILRYE